MQAVVNGPPQRVPLDRRLYARLIDALEEGLTKIEACSAEEYDGPWPEIVLRPDVDKLALGFDWSTQELVVNPAMLPGRETPTLFHGLDYLAEFVIMKMSDRTQIAVQWLEIASYAPYCQNDACANHFEPIVASDPGQVLWHIAASLHTWAQSGVWTPPILAETLAQWAPRIDEWCRENAEANDAYVSFMAAYATRLLDGRVQEHDARWLCNYFDQCTS